jgi:hypothetical protein
MLHLKRTARRRKRKLQEDAEEHEGDSKALNGWMDGWDDDDALAELG